MNLFVLTCKIGSSIAFYTFSGRRIVHESKYVKATQDGIVRLKYKETPINIEGLYTEGLETCFALIFVGDKGITLIHDTDKIFSTTIAEEYNSVGKIVFWATASHPEKKNLDGFNYYINWLEQIKFQKAN